MNGIGRLLPLFSLGLLLPLSACSGGGSEGGGAMFIETCSLGCGSGAGGVQVACYSNQTPLNQEIFVYFSSPVEDVRALDAALCRSELQVYQAASHFLLSSHGKEVGQAARRFLRAHCPPRSPPPPLAALQTSQASA